MSLVFTLQSQFMRVYRCEYIILVNVTVRSHAELLRDLFAVSIYDLVKNASDHNTRFHCWIVFILQEDIVCVANAAVGLRRILDTSVDWCLYRNRLKSRTAH